MNNEIKNLQVNDIVNELCKVDYTHLTNILPSIISIYLPYKISNIATKKIALVKDFEAKKIVPINKIPIIKETAKVNKEKVLKKFLGNDIMQFLDVIHKSLPHVNLTYLHNNVKNLEIYINDLKVWNFVFQEAAVGTYNMRNNYIKIGKNDYLESIFHEFFHMASTFNDKSNDIIFSGFSQLSKNGSIGNGITEGYTEILSDRYFNQGGSYAFEVTITKGLEMIIGQNIMEDLYFKADLFSLINELKKYSKEEEILTFIKNVDLVNDNIHKKISLKFQKNIIQNEINDIVTFLFNCYLIKMKYYFNNNLIDEDLMIKEFNKFIKHFCKNLIINKGKGKQQTIYQYINNEFIENIVNRVNSLRNEIKNSEINHLKIN